MVIHDVLSISSKSKYMSGVNRVILVGRLGKDPEVRNLESGVAVANFSLATSETYKDRTTGEKRETTEWHNIVLWRGLAEIAQRYLHKGDMIYVEGKLRTRSWEKDGITRYTTEVVADNMTMLSTRQGSGMSQPAEMGSSMIPDRGQEPYRAPVDTSSTDDLPF
jgi:single-strand DNA-binding protein